MSEGIDESSLPVAVVPIGDGADDFCSGCFCAFDDFLYVVDEESDDDAGGLCCFGAELVVPGCFFVDVEHGAVDFHFGDVDISLVFEESQHFCFEHILIEFDGGCNDLDGESWCEEGRHT